MIKIKPSYYNALLSSLANKNDPRYYLHGINLTSNYIVASDGVLLTKVIIDTCIEINDDDNIIIIPISIKAKRANKNLKYILIDIDELQAQHIDKNDNIIHIEMFSNIEDNYPNIDRILHKNNKDIEIGYMLNIKSINKVLSSMWVDNAEISPLNERCVNVNINDDNIVIISTIIQKGK